MTTIDSPILATGVFAISSSSRSGNATLPILIRSVGHEIASEIGAVSLRACISPISNRTTLGDGFWSAIGTVIEQTIDAGKEISIELFVQSPLAHISSILRTEGEISGYEGPPTFLESIAIGRILGDIEIYNETIEEIDRLRSMFQKATQSWRIGAIRTIPREDIVIISIQESPIQVKIAKCIAVFRHEPIIDGEDAGIVADGCSTVGIRLENDLAIRSHWGIGLEIVPNPEDAATRIAHIFIRQLRERYGDSIVYGDDINVGKIGGFPYDQQIAISILQQESIL